MTPGPPSPSVPGSPAPDSPPPRAFAQGTGILLQMVGGLLFFSSCCVCASPFWWDDSWWAHMHNNQILDPDQLGSSFWSNLMENPQQLGIMLMVIFTTFGGLALVVFGLGLQSEKPKSGWGAFLTNLALLAILVWAGYNLWLGGASWTALIWHFVVTTAMTILLGFTFVALRQLIKNPPTGDWHTVPADYDPKKENPSSH